MHAEVKSFFHAPSSTWTHLVIDPATGKAALVDPVLDFDYPSGRTATTSAAHIVARIRELGLELVWILETHAHADHLSAAQYVREELGGKVAIGEGIRTVQTYFSRALNFESGFHPDGSQFDHLFNDEEHFAIGKLAARVISTPGHTLDSVSYLVGDALFVGDTIFMPDGGTARCDFPGGDAGLLYDSIHKLFELPDETRVFVCHDYAAGGRVHRSITSIGEQRRRNIHVRDGITREEFIELRGKRDRTLGMPSLLYPSVQVNVRGGELPPAESNGQAYLKIPVLPSQRRSA